MYPNLPGSERFRVVGVIDPDANAAGDISTGWIDMGQFDTLTAIIMAGDLGASATLDAKFEQATSDAGAGAKALSPARAITQLTKAGTDDNKQALLNVSADDLDVTNNFRYARLTMTVGTATSDSGAVVLGFDARYGPGDHLATVDETVS